MCFKICEHDSARFLTTPRLEWQVILKKTKVNLDPLTDNQYLIKSRKYQRKGIRGGICHSIHQYERDDNKYIKDYYENEESSYHKYWDVNNSYDWAMYQKLPLGNFKWVENISEFNEDFIKSYINESDEGYFFEVDVQYPKNLQILHNYLPFLS